MTVGRATFSGSDQFWVHEVELLPEVDTWAGSNGLVLTAEHGAVVLTSEFMGLVDVVVDVHETRPAGADDPYGLTGGQDWDDIVEVSVHSVVGPLLVRPLDGEADLPRLDAAGPGEYRLRVHARNRDLPGTDAEGLESSTDEYRLVCWPEPAWGTFPIRLTDRRGADLRLSAALAGQDDDGHSHPEPEGWTEPAPTVWPGSAPAGARILRLVVEDGD